MSRKSPKQHKVTRNGKTFWRGKGAGSKTGHKSQKQPPRNSDDLSPKDKEVSDFMDEISNGKDGDDYFNEIAAKIVGEQDLFEGLSSSKKRQLLSLKKAREASQHIYIADEKRYSAKKRAASESWLLKNKFVDKDQQITKKNKYFQKWADDNLW